MFSEQVWIAVISAAAAITVAVITYKKRDAIKIIVRVFLPSRQKPSTDGMSTDGIQIDLDATPAFPSHATLLDGSAHTFVADDLPSEEERPDPPVVPVERKYRGLVGDELLSQFLSDMQLDLHPSDKFHMTDREVGKNG
ncbi:MAG: hypothetical protein FWF21_01985 [Micrococcales bacterium]|nr:hypothetical protein [Micrococcales bacterium]